MSRRYFSGLSADFDRPGPKAWWRVMSLWGWMLLFFAVFATVSFIAGAICGEVLFLPPAKQRSGSVWGANLAREPLLYFVLMAANAVVAGALWALFIRWLRRRGEKQGIWL